MLLKKGQIAGVWDAMTFMWRPRYISILNMVQVQVQNGLFSQKSSLGVETTNQQEKNNLKNISLSFDNS